jgi:hypothetical protein
MLFITIPLHTTALFSLCTLHYLPHWTAPCPTWCTALPHMNIVCPFTLTAFHTLTQLAAIQAKSFSNLLVGFASALVLHSSQSHPEGGEATLSLKESSTIKHSHVPLHLTIKEVWCIVACTIFPRFKLEFLEPWWCLGLNVRKLRCTTKVQGKSVYP